MADPKTKRLAGKVAVITGSGRGIGRCEALLMARQGAQVVVSDIGTDGEGTRTAEQVAGEVRAVGGEAVAVTENVATLEGARRTVEAALQSYGRLDILVNNAGLRAGNPIDKLTEEQWDLVVDSHLKASFAMIKSAVPVFKRQGGGVIINTGSEAGLGMIFNSAYAAAKEGIAGLTRSVAREQGRFGIRCNMIRPRATVNTGGGAWGKEVGLWSEPELIRSLTRPGGWDLDSLDACAREAMTADLTNPFLIDDPLRGNE